MWRTQWPVGVFSSFNRKSFLENFEQDIHWKMSKGSFVFGDINQMIEKISPFMQNSYQVRKSTGVPLCSASLIFPALGYSNFVCWNKTPLVFPQLTHFVMQATKLTVSCCFSLPEAVPLIANANMAPPTRHVQVPPALLATVLTWTGSNPVFALPQSSAPKNLSLIDLSRPKLKPLDSTISRLPFKCDHYQ